MMFTHLEVYTPVDLKSIDTPKGRFYYTPEGNKYPSITTILNDGDKQWVKEWQARVGFQTADRKKKEAAARGSAVHKMLEDFLNNVEDPTKGQPPLYRAQFHKLRMLVRRINNIHVQEAALWSDTMRIAGRVDCIGEYNGVLSLIDFKTSTNAKTSDQIEDYYLQATAYALMYEEQTGIKIEQLVILMSVENEAVPFLFVKPIEPYIKPLLKRVSKYYKQRAQNDETNNR